MEKLITSEHLSNIKFAADCAIKEPDSIYSQEFFMLLDETFGSKGDYESPTQAVAVAWLINRVNELAQRAEAAEAALERESDIHIDTAASMREWRLRAEATEARLAQREKLDEEAMHCATILEFIGSFESDDIDGDLVDLRFEIDGEDTGSDVSITEYALRSAKAIRAIISGASISRPAPAADPAELVPEEAIPDENACEWVDGWNACRAAILRNIEETK